MDSGRSGSRYGLKQEGKVEVASLLYTRAARYLKESCHYFQGITGGCYVPMDHTAAGNRAGGGMQVICQAMGGTGRAAKAMEPQGAWGGAIPR